MKYLDGELAWRKACGNAMGDAALGPVNIPGGRVRYFVELPERNPPYYDSAGAFRQFGLFPDWVFQIVAFARR